MPAHPRLTGEPIMRILCRNTDSLVGYLYQWDNGDLQPAWLDEALTDVRYVPMEQAAGAVTPGVNRLECGLSR